MKTVGKILLFISGLLFFIFGVLQAVSIITTCVSSPATFFGQNPIYAGIVALVIFVLWTLLYFMGGYSGMIYALKGKNFGWVKALSYIIIVVFILNLIDLIATAISNKAIGWSDISSLVYGGVAGILYVIGYFLDRKKRA